MEEKQEDRDFASKKAAAIYSKPTLSLYDFVVLGFFNQFVWKCPSDFLLNNYDMYVGLNHLDVGVGTGYFLDNCKFFATNKTPNIHLMDLNPNSLEFAAKRIRRYHPKKHLVNILKPLTIDVPKFDSIGMNYLLHCLPGDMQSKEVVFKNLIPLLKEGGAIFGATMLGKNIHRNFLARQVMRLYNSKGIFNNTEDDFDSLKQILHRNLRKYSIQVIGCAAVFGGTI